MELQGRIKKLLPLQSGVSQSSGNPWKKQEFIFGYYEGSDSIFEKNIKLDIMNDKIQELGLQEGDTIKVRVSLNCREYPVGSGKYFNDIRTGDITIIKRRETNAQQPTGGVSTAQPNNNPQQQQPAPSAPANNEQADDLPF